MTQSLLPLPALLVAVIHLHYISNQDTLEFPQLHPLQLRETDSEPPIALVVGLLRCSATRALSPVLEVLATHLRDKVAFRLFNLHKKTSLAETEYPWAGVLGIETFAVGVLGITMSIVET